MGLPDNLPNNLPDNAESALTSIRDSYTLPCTPEPYANEVDKFMIENFLQTLSEIALAIAARKAQDNSNPEVKP
jgi:hypothetical protein